MSIFFSASQSTISLTNKPEAAERSVMDEDRKRRRDQRKWLKYIKKHQLQPTQYVPCAPGDTDEFIPPLANQIEKNMEYYQQFPVYQQPQPQYQMPIQIPQFAVFQQINYWAATQLAFNGDIPPIYA